jgi:hypothetical protein
MELHQPQEQAWFSSDLLGVWALSLCGVIIGGVVSWVGLGMGFCESSNGAESATYCQDGGWQAAGIGVIGSIGLALVLPLLALVTDRRLLFRLGLVFPPVLIAADVALSLVFAIP